MKPADPKELMHAVLDGEASAEERAALEALLAADPAARREFDALRALFDEIKLAPAPALPADLAQRIARRASMPIAVKSRGIPVYYRYAACVVGGVLLGAVVTQNMQIQGPEPDALAVAGSMVRGPGDATGSVARPDVAGVDGTLALRRSDGLLVLTVALQAEGDLMLVLPLDGALRVVGVVGLEASPPALNLDENRLQVLHSGQQGYAVLLQGDDQPVTFELYRGGQRVHQASISAPDAN